ncbi:Cyclic pyranopterin monophosphate synthase accessory protein 1 [Symmachiella dynata]|nr:Cyclic pyranopterin monophosphate synthase accessory protein 1 [Symmachiella dynata]
MSGEGGKNQVMWRHGIAGASPGCKSIPTPLFSVHSRTSSAESAVDGYGDWLRHTGVVMAELTHFNEDGASRMVDVSEKPVTARMARAAGTVRMQSATRQLIVDRKLSKGDVLEVARLAGIMAAKKTADLIPLCHPLGLDAVEVEFETPGDDVVRIIAVARVQGRTGVEMEAMTAVSVAALTIYDMCKAVDRGMTIGEIELLEKAGGKSGHYLRE